MKITPTEMELIETQTYGDVTCGKVVAFNFQRKVQIAIPKYSVKHPKTYIASGDSLKDVGILNGDILICSNFFNRDSIHNKVCIVRVHNDYLAKIVIPNGDGTITLKSANPYYIDYTVDADLVEIVGVVKKIQRDLY